MKQRLSSVFMLLFCMLFAFCSDVKAQTQYLVKLNLTDGQFTKINKIHGVDGIVPGYAVYNSDAALFSFCGMKDSAKKFLYTISTETGKIVSVADYSYERNGHFFSTPAYNPADKTVYAIHWDRAYRTEYLAKTDPVTGAYTDVLPLPGISAFALATATLDAGRQHYIFKGTDSADVNRMYVLDIAAKEIVSATVFPATGVDSGNALELFYDKDSDKLIGFFNHRYSQSVSVISIDAATGDFAVIKHLPDVQHIAPFRTSYDAVHHYLSFNGLAETGSTLYTIDVATGAMVHMAKYPSLQKGDNLMYPVYDAATNTTYALYWEPHTMHVSDNPASMVEIYPNPFSNKTTIGLGSNYNDVSVTLYNAIGQPVMSKYLEQALNIDISIDPNSIQPGTYYARIMAGLESLGTVRLAITN